MRPYISQFRLSEGNVTQAITSSVTLCFCKFERTSRGFPLKEKRYILFLIAVELRYVLTPARNEYRVGLDHKVCRHG
jgi:hypothetical protein